MCLMHCELYLIFTDTHTHTQSYIHLSTSFPLFLLASWMSIFWFIIIVASLFDSVLFLFVFFTISKTYLCSIWLINRSLFNWAKCYLIRFLISMFLHFMTTTIQQRARENVNGSVCKCPLLQVKLIILINHWVEDDQWFGMMMVIIDQWMIIHNKLCVTLCVSQQSQRLVLLFFFFFSFF